MVIALFFLSVMKTTFQNHCKLILQKFIDRR